MSANGSIQGDYASLSGKIHTLVIDKTLSISGAAADAKATGERIDKLDDRLSTELQAEVKAELGNALKDIGYLTHEEIAAICK